MKHSTAAAAFAVALSMALAGSARADQITPPPVPAGLEVPQGHNAFHIGHAFGSQNYVCLPSATGYSWILYGPQATLFDEDGEQQITHFLSPNPVEGGTPRATWQHSRDTSSVWAFALQPPFSVPDAIPWLKLQVVGTQFGPTGGGKLARTTYIQRVNTVGGLAPATGCASATDVGKKALVPYEADYVFYREKNSGS